MNVPTRSSANARCTFFCVSEHEFDGSSCLGWWHQVRAEEVSITMTLTNIVYETTSTRSTPPTKTSNVAVVTTAPFPTFQASCHCGALAFTFETAIPGSRWQIRACQCSFCRRHAARTTSDPAGRVSFRLRDTGSLLRYRFGLRTADFLVCHHCGVYMAAVLTS